MQMRWNVRFWFIDDGYVTDAVGVDLLFAVRGYSYRIQMRRDWIRFFFVCFLYSRDGVGYDMILHPLP